MLWLPKNMGTLQEHCKGRQEPDAERSPKKESDFFDKEAACEFPPGSGDFAQAAVYDISDKDVAVQTNSVRDHYVSRASQTQALPKPRRSPCNGPAAQPDILDT